ERRHRDIARDREQAEGESHPKGRFVRQDLVRCGRGVARNTIKSANPCLLCEELAEYCRQKEEQIDNTGNPGLKAGRSCCYPLPHVSRSCELLWVAWLPSPRLCLHM